MVVIMAMITKGQSLLSKHLQTVSHTKLKLVVPNKAMLSVSLTDVFSSNKAAIVLVHNGFES